MDLDIFKTSELIAMKMNWMKYKQTPCIPVIRSILENDKTASLAFGYKFTTKTRKFRSKSIEGRGTHALQFDVQKTSNAAIANC